MNHPRVSQRNVENLLCHSTKKLFGVLFVILDGFCVCESFWGCPFDGCKISGASQMDVSQIVVESFLVSKKNFARRFFGVSEGFCYRKRMRNKTITIFHQKLFVRFYRNFSQEGFVVFGSVFLCLALIAFVCFEKLCQGKQSGGKLEKSL